MSESEHKQVRHQAFFRLGNLLDLLGDTKVFDRRLADCFVEMIFFNDTIPLVSGDCKQSQKSNSLLLVDLSDKNETSSPTLSVEYDINQYAANIFPKLLTFAG